MAPQTNVAVLFGGRSVEHEISVITGLQLIDALDVTRHRAVPVYIATDGRWFTGSALLDPAFYRSLPGALSQVDEVTLLPSPGRGLVRLREPTPRRDVSIDVCIPALHGSYGEDGCVQGLFELADIPYAGSPVRASATAMHKPTCKELAAAVEIDVLPHGVVRGKSARQDLRRAREVALECVGRTFPLVVKPCSLGSSIGVQVVRDTPELDAALLRVFDIDTEAMLEPFLANMVEINVAVLDDDPPLMSVIEVPHSSGAGLLTYEDKYLRESAAKGSGPASAGMASLARAIDPADVAPTIKDQARITAARVFETAGCSGVARIDFMLDAASGRLFFNELNTLPGSLAFYLWNESKPALLYPELLNRLVDRALALHHEKRVLRRSEPFRALAGSGESGPATRRKSTPKRRSTGAA